MTCLLCHFLQQCRLDSENRMCREYVKSSLCAETVVPVVVYGRMSKLSFIR